MSFLAVSLAYLIGSLSVGYLVGKVGKGIDVRKHGSGNVGTTNILRTLGVLPAVLVLILDMAKGVAAVYLALWLTANPTVAMLSGLAAVIGHNWPVWFGFRGGRGIATSIGVILAFNPTAFGVLLLIGIIIILITRYVSLASITGAALFPPTLWFFRNAAAIETGTGVILVSIFIAALAIERHKGNIERLRKGTESKIGEKVKFQ
jgi:acyl phosphate:glycerol-3-phosphate acyltransferase